MPRVQDIFLVATYLKAPKDPRQCIHKGYIKDDKNISYREKVTVTRGLKDRDLTAGIILNLTQKTVYKCRFEGKNDWETLASYYAKSYPNYLKLIDPPKPEPDPDPDTELVVSDEGNVETKVIESDIPEEEDGK